MSISKFSSRELDVMGTYLPFSKLCGNPQMPYEKLNFPITPKENLKLFLQRKECAWIPDICTDVNLILDYTTPDNRVQNRSGGIDSFGVVWDPLKDMSLPAFVTPGHPVLSDISEWVEMKLPNPDEWDWKTMQGIYKEHAYPDRANYGFLPGVYLERLIHLLDSENAFCALAADEEEVSAFFERITDIHCKNLEHQKNDLNVDIVWISDDWGTQRAPFMSRETMNKVFAPSYRRLMNKCKELEIAPVTHCCGRVAEYMPEMVDMGVTILEPQTLVNPELFSIFEPLKDKLFIEDYSLFTDEGCVNLNEYREKMEKLAVNHLLEGNIFITSGIYGAQLEEKRKILYEILRKAASGNL